MKLRIDYFENFVRVESSEATYFRLFKQEQRCYRGLFKTCLLIDSALNLWTSLHMGELHYSATSSDVAFLAPKTLDPHFPVTQTLADHSLICTLMLSSLVDPGSRKGRHHLPAWRSATLFSVPGTTASEAGSNLQASKAHTWRADEGTARASAKNRPLSVHTFDLRFIAAFQLKCGDWQLMTLWL
jgi:hypothetical protein